MRSNTKQKHKPATRFETSPERIACVEDVLNALEEIGGIDALGDICQSENMKRLAARLRLPHVELERIVNGWPTEADVEEYNNWRAALGKGK